MASFKFLHTADLHVDSPLRGLERYEGAPVDRIRRATREALTNVVDLAIAENVRLVLIAGDLHDVDWKDYNTGLFFNREMSRLREHGIPVALVKGNHDAASEITRHLLLPANVRELPVDHAASIAFPDIECVVHGQGFAKRHCDENVVRQFPPAEPGAFNIGLLHTSAAGHIDHEPYAPCTLDDLRSLGYEYWALGHVHQRQILGERPWIVYPGNPQGRHIRETSAKGCFLVTVEDGQIVGPPEFRAVDVFRWERSEVDLTAASTYDAALEAVREGLEAILASVEDRGVAVRLILGGASAAHPYLVHDPERTLNEIRSIAADAGGDQLWIESVCFRTRSSLALGELVQRDDALGGLLASIEALKANPQEALPVIREALGPLETKLPVELRRAQDALLPTEPEGIRELLDEVEQLLMAHLLDQGEIA